MQKVSIVTLGCPKNQADSELIKGLLLEKGYSYEQDPALADVIVVNTCGFIEDAKQESINTLLEMAQYKKIGRCRLMVATGCLAQRYGKELMREMPEIDVLVGTTSFPEIVEAINQAAQGKRVLNIRHPDFVIPEGLPRDSLENSHYAYLRIAEGCDNHCSYCIIPRIRGRYRSRRWEDILEEGRSLVSGGAKELILIAQDTTGYGRDLYGERKLPWLLSKLCDIDGLYWLRLLYCYPDGITRELVETMNAQPKLCNYLDIPIQHASDRILRSMNRRTTAAQTERLLSYVKENIPGVVIRSTLIVGFPGETDDDFQKLLNLVRKGYIDRLGVFVYSREEDTPAYGFSGRVPRSTAEERREILMLEQQRISIRNNRAMVGKVLEVLTDGHDQDGYYGRTYGDAPEIDNAVLFHSDREIKAGEYVRVKVEHALEYDLVG
ncbi:MAG TPA: 30S ribosomal protein S12 methylthiotransferase RimO, partial [Clostridia bacterium]|nr:30S ribosomal protein S12 methylthiotransferase RimO [Clostridia bacterium]